MAAAAAHHRFAWIHPFLDRNGRVVRLMSHATLLDSLDTGSLWSVSRGLARNGDAYKRHAGGFLNQRPRFELAPTAAEIAARKRQEFTRFFLEHLH